MFTSEGFQSLLAATEKRMALISSYSELEEMIPLPEGFVWGLSPSRIWVNDARKDKRYPDHIFRSDDTSVSNAKTIQQLVIKLASA